MMRRVFAIPAALLALGCARRESGNAAADTATARTDSSQTAPVAAAANVDSNAKTNVATAGRTSAARGTDHARSGARRDSSPPSGNNAMGSSSAADTARGIVAVVGTSFDSRVVIRPSSGGRPISLIGPQAKSVGRMSGADVWVTGSRDERGEINVSRFTVRSVDGLPALDGTLITRGDQLLLVTRDGKEHAIGNAPAALRQQVGARVWVTGPLDKGPVTFGVIEERR
jgi:hypothetical protein